MSLILTLTLVSASAAVESSMRICGRPTSLKPVIGAPSAKENLRSIVCVACSVGSVFFLKVIVACILRSGMSASAFTATVAGWPGAGGISDQTVEPKLTTGFCGLSAEAMSMLALASVGAAGGGAADSVGTGAGEPIGWIGSSLKISCSWYGVDGEAADCAAAPAGRSLARSTRWR